MKKLFITIVFVAAAMFANAQFFIGGNLGLSTQGGKDKLTSGGLTVEQDAPKSFGFQFAPSLGYMFNDNIGIGIDFMIGMAKTTEKDYTVDPVLTTTTKTTTIGFAPYFRYVFAEVDNFKFYGDVKLAYVMEKPKVTVDGSGLSVSSDGPKTTTFGVGIVPGMAYYFTDHISMNCVLNILELGFESQKTVVKEVDGDGGEYTTKATDFGFGINMPTPITVGFFYTF
jgi:hypothetical protein